MVVKGRGEVAVMAVLEAWEIRTPVDPRQSAVVVETGEGLLLGKLSDDYCDDREETKTDRTNQVGYSRNKIASKSPRNRNATFLIYCEELGCALGIRSRVVIRASCVDTSMNRRISFYASHFRRHTLRVVVRSFSVGNVPPEPRHKALLARETSTFFDSPEPSNFPHCPSHLKRVRDPMKLD